MKIIAIDAIDINSFGGLIHLKQITQILSKKKILLKIYANKFVNKNLKLNSNIKIIRKPIFDKNFLIRHLWKIVFLNKELKKNKCNILLSLNGIYHGFFKPTILVQQNILPFETFAKKNYDLFSNLKFYLQKKAILISIKFHKNVIFTSHDIKNKIINNLNYKKSLRVSVIYHGVNKTKSVKRKIFSKKNNKFLFISEFQKYKNHEKLFEVFKIAKNKNLSLTCIGKYKIEYLNYLKSKYDLNTLKIKILKDNSHRKILNIYKNYDALIFPSLCESFGLPVLEAAANKIPILCSDLKIFREIYGYGCFYFNPKKTRSILNQISNFLTLNKIEIKNKTNYAYIISRKLSWNRCGNEYS